MQSWVTEIVLPRVKNIYYLPFYKTLCCELHSKKQFWLSWFLKWYFYFQFNFCSHLYSSSLVFFIFFLPSQNSLFLFTFFSFLVKALEAINFPLSSSITASHKFWYVIFSLSFNSKYFKISIMISLINELFRNALKFPNIGGILWGVIF